MRESWYRRPQVWLALGVFAVALSVYLATMSSTISFWDCGEFITTSHILGIPHQPGTPLYVLMGRCFDILLGSADTGSPAPRTAWAINFMSAFFSALALMFVYLIVCRLARRADPDSGWLAHAGGVIGAFFLLFSQTYWNNAIEAEVYGLAAFIISSVTWLSLRWFETCSERRSDRILYLIIYMLGLGVGFHLGSLLVYPGIFVLVWLARERQLALTDLLLMSAGLALFLFSTMTRNNGLLVLLLVAYLGLVAVRTFLGRRFALIGSALFLLGLTVHLYMLLRAPLDPAINQSQPDDFATLVSVLRREQYPPLNVFDRQADFGWQIKYYYNFFLQQFYFLGDGQGMLARMATLLGPIFLGLLGIFHGIRRLRPVIWLLITNYLINADALTVYLNFTDHEVRERDYFYFPAFLFFAIFIGIGAAALLRYAVGPEGKAAADLQEGERPERVRIGWLPRVSAGFLLVIAALPALQPGHTKWFEHDRSENRIAREYAWNLLAGLDQDAIIFTNGDNDTFPVWYLQEVEHFRRDVTVVNLSLVNLAWYVKQMRRREPPLALTYSNDEIDKLRAEIYQDPRTGQAQIVYVRDYVVADIVRTNAQGSQPRPVYFAVTIPTENMERYYPYLQMEGLAYRLANRKSEDGHPVVDSGRLLANMLGIYTYESLLDGDNQQRQGHFTELAGWQQDAVTAAQLGSGPPADIPYELMLPDLGIQRRDVYRDTNTRHLLGNYPAAFVRAGYDYLLQAQKVATTDTVTYDRLFRRAITAFEAAYRFNPTLQPVMDLYPLLLVEDHRFDEALGYLEQIKGRVIPEAEDRTVSEVCYSLANVGRLGLAQGYLNQRIAADPDHKYFYDLLFQLNQTFGTPDACREVIERWRAHSGQQDEAMVRALADMIDRQQRPDSLTPQPKENP